MSRTSIHSSSGTLSNLILWIYLSLPLYNHKGFDLCHICLWRRSPNQWTTVEVPSLQISLCLHTPHILISFNCPLSFFGLYHHLHYLFSSSYVFLLSSDNLFTIFANEKPNQKKWEQKNNTLNFTILFCRNIWIHILHAILQNSEDILQSYLWNFVFLNIFILLQINGRSSHNFLIEYNFAFFNNIFFIISKSNTISSGYNCEKNIAFPRLLFLCHFSIMSWNCICSWDSAHCLTSYPFRYTHLNAEFQRVARRDKKAFLSDQYKEIEENSRMGKTRDLFKKIRQDGHNKVQ